MTLNFTSTSILFNPYFTNQNDFPNIKSLKNKMNIVKSRTNSHDPHSDIDCWTNPKTH